MKLRADSFKDHYDVVELYKTLNEKEKIETHQLAELVKRGQKLRDLLQFQRQKPEVEEDQEHLLEPFRRKVRRKS